MHTNAHTTSEGTKPARFNVRMPESARLLIDKAAALEGRTVSDFVLSSAVMHARATLTAHEQLILSEQSGVRFAEAVLQPPKAQKKLQDAVREYSTFVNE